MAGKAKCTDPEGRIDALVAVNPLLARHRLKCRPNSLNL